jgi:hypothetical protein
VLQGAEKFRIGKKEARRRKRAFDNSFPSVVLYGAAQARNVYEFVQKNQVSKKKVEFGGLVVDAPAASDASASVYSGVQLRIIMCTNVCLCVCLCVFSDVHFRQP